MKTYKASCGCEFPLLEEMEDGRKKLDVTLVYRDVNYFCPATWSLLQAGHTKGVFQLETGFAQSYSERLGPENLDHLAALTAILRPGPLKSGMADSFIKRKNGEEDAEAFDKSLEEILSPTYQCLIFQEQSMRIGVELGGMDPITADRLLRKGIGKKIPELIAKAKEVFVNGAEKKGLVTREQAENIFGWIEKGSRYVFNASHSYGYAYLSYITAYIKAHFPTQFYCEYLRHARGEANPREEIAELVEDAKQIEIYVMPPDIRQGIERFDIIDNQIYFGITDIKNIGKGHYEDLMQYAPFYDNWHQMLTEVLANVNKRTAEGLIKSGALRYLRVDRTQMAYEYAQLQHLREKEIEFLAGQENLTDGLTALIALPTGKGQVVHQKNRLEKLKSVRHALENPPYVLSDTAADVARMETDALGIPLTCTKLSDTDKSFLGNSDCGGFLKGGLDRGLIIPAIIIEVRKIVDKKGRDMAFLKLRDDTATIDTVVFASKWEELRGKCIEGSMILAHGSRSNTNKKSLILLCK